MELTLAETALRLFVAGLIGASIGIEREFRGHPAGFRTLTVLSVASALVMVLSMNLGTASYDSALVRTDPGRIAAQAISGIGFLGAGVILRMGLTVHGITTAAVMWAITGLGLAVGAGLILESLIAGGFILGALVLLPPLERSFLREAHRVRLRIRARPRRGLVEELSNALREQGLKIDRLSILNQSDDELNLKLSLHRTSAGGQIDPALVLLAVKGIDEVEEYNGDSPID